MVPNSFLCPITQDIMEDPVTTIDGSSYERSAIESWFARGKRTSPLTNVALSTTTLVPNRALRNSIREYLEQHEIQHRERLSCRDEAVALRLQLDEAERRLRAMSLAARNGGGKKGSSGPRSQPLFWTVGLCLELSMS